jgi:Domain of unknown function (DUF4386)
MTAPGPLARTAGLLYLAVAVGGAFAISVRTRIVERGNAAATAENLRASGALFRAGFLSDLVAGACFLLTAIALYGLLKHVHELVAAAMVTIVAVGVAIGSLNSLNEYTALTIATGGEYARTFGAAGADRLAMLYVDAAGNGGNIAFVFFALWLLPLGYLVIRSGYFPKILGVLLIVGCCGYLAGVFTDLLAHDAGEGILMFFGAIGGLPELAFVVWLLVKGVRTPSGGRRP